MDDNLYSIEEEQEEPIYKIEDSELNIEPEDEAEAWNGESGDSSKKSVFRVLIQILATPVEGWKSLKRSNYGDRTIGSNCFYPLLALASISEYTALFYEADTDFVSLLIPAIITFITFFFSYFTVLLCGSFLLPQKAKDVLNMSFGKEYVMMSLSTLVIFYVVYRIMPLLGPILAFLPLWTIYIVVKGVKLFRIPKEKENHTAAMMSFMIIGAPILWNWILSEILQNRGV